MKQQFLTTLRAGLIARYPWAQDEARLDRFMESARQTVNGSRSMILDGEAIREAWASCNTGKLTYKALHAMPDDTPTDAVCENCGKPCSYHPEICLCTECEQRTGQHSEG